MKSTDTRNPRPLLKVKDLTIAYHVAGESLEVLHEISLDVMPGQTLGVVGESGSGKTTLALGILGYLPESGTVAQGSISFHDRNLLTLSNQQKQKIWGSQIAFVPQDALSSLNPTLPVGKQMLEILLQHLPISKQEAQQQAIELLDLVRIPDPAQVFKNHPHQMSGGMQQRVMIAMAISLNPQLLVLDEPTTNLDMTTQATILDLIQELVLKRDTTVIYVTHNLGVVSHICDQVAVLYAGELVEGGPTDEVLRTPLHPYTRGLLDSVPTIDSKKHGSPLRSIHGRIPAPSERRDRCIFLPRCPIATEICKVRPPLFSTTKDRSTRCHRWEEIAVQKIVPTQPHSEIKITDHSFDQDEPVLKLDSIKVHFPTPRSILDHLKGQTKPPVRALNGINFSLSHGKTLGLVGESGSGKTTLARAILGLLRESEGQIEFLSTPLPPLLEGRDLATLRNIQMIFQDPQESLNPHITLGDALQRPLKRMQGMNTVEAEERSRTLLKMVHLPENFLGRIPSQLSGGEIQRAAIARAFATNPKLLLADEPVSALDVSVQASILNLLMQLQLEKNTATLLISHDITAVGYLADMVAVIYLGKLMEITDAQDLFTPPLHPYTEALISAMPSVESGRKYMPIRLEGDLPRPTTIPAGCPFVTRCPRNLGEICQHEEPPWQELSSGKRIYCHIPGDELLALQKTLELENNPGEG